MDPFHLLLCGFLEVFLNAEMQMSEVDGGEERGNFSKTVGNGTLTKRII